MAEYIGVRGEITGCDINGNPFYNMYLTDEEIIRCRDCKFHAGENDAGIHPEMCLQFSELTMDDGFCAWSERDE